MLRSLLLSVLLAVPALGCGSDPAPGAPATTPATTPAAGLAPADTTAPAHAAATIDPNAPAERLQVRVVEQFPHDPTAFTQGLLLVDGVLYESTGLEGASSVRRVDLPTGAVLAARPQAADVFGEGLAMVGAELYQLSWRNGLAFVYDRTTLEPLRQYRYTGEGWGLCFDGEVLWHSDGTTTLRRRDPATFEVLGTVTVLDGTSPVANLNELECVDGSIYANVWLSNEVVRIDAASGKVTARIDASALAPRLAGPDDVLNGIAYDADNETYLLTGKRWDTVYRVVFEPVTPSGATAD